MTLAYEKYGVTVHHGDCLDVLPTLSDASVHAVVCDPPYELAFMGKSWDSSGVAFNPAVWRECLRVLKPGGHLLAFGGSRTWHRLACAIEDAGFELRDSIAWLYGCHDDRTEVLTARGWVNGLDLTGDDVVAQWNTDGTITLVKPSVLQRYPFEGRLVRFRNADVDQLVTPNHRVYLQTSERVQVNGVRSAAWSDWRVEQAADINRWQRMRIPAAGIHDGPGIGGTDYAALLGWVWTEGGFDLSGTGVRVYQSSTNAAFVDEITSLFDRLGPHKRYDYERTWKGRTYTATTWYISGDFARRVRTDLPGKVPTWDLLWRMTADEKRALWDAAMKGDGSKAQRTFWQKDRASLEWAQALLTGIGCRGKVADDPRGALHWTDRATVELQARHLADDGEDYTGEVWCVTVPSGAFVVRRSGRVSVSGNSGFPKSLDVSKAIDKARDDSPARQAVGTWLRVRRRAVGLSTNEVGAHWPSASGGPTGCVRNWELGLNCPTWEQWLKLRTIIGFGDEMDAEVWRLNGRKGTPGHERADRVVTDLGGNAIYQPTQRVVHAGTPVLTTAQQWAGWGTALKPAFEPIVVARKPLGERTVAANVLAHGTGALHIDACRVPATDKAAFPVGYVRGAGTTYAQDAHTKSMASSSSVDANPGGRWPTNVVLDGDAADALDEQSGSRRSRAGQPRSAAKGDGWRMTATGAEYNDEGGASRFFPVFRYQAKAPTSERPTYTTADGRKVAHPTVKPLALMRWLVRLVTPPGGVVLDPFAGSGSTLEAALLEDFRAIGVEREESHLPLIGIRLDRATAESTPTAPDAPLVAETLSLLDLLDDGAA